MEAMLKHFINDSPIAHRVSYYDWNDGSDKPVLLCVHGLYRNGKDFDYIANELSKHYRVICPDMPGRGNSEYFSPANILNYNYVTYVADIFALCNHLKVNNIDYIGTSMGGIIAMAFIASYPGIIRRLVLNDIGSFIFKEGLIKTVRRPGNSYMFSTQQEIEQVLIDRFINNCSVRTKEQKDFLLKISVNQVEGGFVFNYHKVIADSFNDEVKDVDLSEVWEKTICEKILVLHGVNSLILVPETIQQMRKSKDNLTVIDIPDCGHVPALMDPQEINVVRQWLLT